jgi:hypothetical protein
MLTVIKLSDVIHIVSFTYGNVCVYVCTCVCVCVGELYLLSFNSITLGLCVPSQS